MHTTEESPFHELIIIQQLTQVVDQKNSAIADSC